VSPVAEQVKYTQPGSIDNDRLAVDETLPHWQVLNRCDNHGEAVGEIVSVPSEQRNAFGIPPSQDAKAVVLIS
jgi:hypothetical protein